MHAYKHVYSAAQMHRLIYQTWKLELVYIAEYLITSQRTKRMNRKT